MQTHKVTIRKDASVQIEVNGVKGCACKDATAALEQKLGTVTSTAPTGEAYEQPDVSTVNQ